MKKQIVILALATLGSQNLQALTKVQDLAVNCNLKAKVIEVFNIKYNKGLPAHGRFNGIEPSLSYEANLETISEEPGCSVLKNKYQIFLGSLKASGGLSPALESEAILISELKGKVIDLKINQQIGYQYSKEYLPLFPLVHAETLSLVFSYGKISGSVPLPFDLNWVYSIPKLENLTDIEKLSLAEKTTGYIYNKLANYDFLNLFLKLEPLEKSLKKSYALVIWKTFKEYKESTPYSKPILQFHVGGEGFDYGAPLAKKLNVISHFPEVFSSAEIVQLLSDFPTWILSGYSESECLNFNSEELELFLENIQVKLPVITNLEKGMLKDPMTHIAGPIHYVSNCTENKVTEKAKVLAQDILKTLN